MDEDTKAFNEIMKAFSMPKITDDEKKARSEAIQAATKYACQVPLEVMKKASSSLEFLETMIEKGNQNALTDVGVGVLCVNAAVHGTYMNVMVNAKGLKDRIFAEKIMTEAKNILAGTHQKADELIAKVENAIL